MMIKNYNIHLIVVLILGTIFFSASSCSETPPFKPQEKSPVLKIIFNHTIDGEPITFDKSIYVNDAGNPYLINEIQYFVTELTFLYDNGNEVIADSWKPFHYVDTDLDNTMNWTIPDTLLEGNVTALHLRLGFRDEVNESFMFVNPPERDMFWPEYLGGGYHYMKLNGKWEPADGSFPNLPFDFHVGRGQIYDNGGVITGFVDNSMEITFEDISFSLKNDDTTTIAITMQVDNWFQNPHSYNHDVWGGYIMNNQEAMQLAVDNSHDVFILSVEEQP